MVCYQWATDVTWQSRQKPKNCNMLFTLLLGLEHSFKSVLRLLYNYFPWSITREKSNFYLIVIYFQAILNLRFGGFFLLCRHFNASSMLLQNQCSEIKPAAELVFLSVVLSSLLDIVTGVLGICRPQLK